MRQTRVAVMPVAARAIIAVGRRRAAGGDGRAEAPRLTISSNHPANYATNEEALANKGKTDRKIRCDLVAEFDPFAEPETPADHQEQ